MADKVKRKKINWKQTVRAADPEIKKKQVVYRFSNGREFKEK